MKHLALAILAAFAAAQPAAAQDQFWQMATGNDVLEVCTRQGERGEMICLGWVNGFVAGVRMTQSVAGQNVVCFPDGATIGQYRDIIVGALREEPAQRHYASRALALGALTIAYPCQPS